MIHMDCHFVYENDATCYEVSVTRNTNEASKLFGRYIVSVSNFGECFICKDLRSLADTILNESKMFSITDAINIHNAVAINVEELPIATIIDLNREIIEYSF